MSDWWTQSARPILKTGGDVSSGDIAANAVTCGALAAGAVTATSLGTGVVSSENATATLATRSAVGQAPGPAKGAGYSSTSQTVWRASVRSEITRVVLTPLTCFAAVTSCGNVQVWSCVGAIGSFTATSTSIGSAGVPIVLASLTNTCVAACQDVMIGISNINACDTVPALLVQLDYKSSG